MYTIMGIRRTSQSVRKLDLVAKFIQWFDKCELNGTTNDDVVDDIIEDVDYILHRNILFLCFSYEHIYMDY